MNQQLAACLRVAGFVLTLGIVGGAPSLAQNDSGQAYGTSVKFHDVAFDNIAIEVRTGATEDQSVAYGNHVFKKGDTWTVSANMPVFWRRELHPGSGDGQFTAWQRVMPSEIAAPVELTA